MKRGWSSFGMAFLMSILAATVLFGARVPVPESDRPAPPAPTWKPINLDIAMWLSYYTDREDWTGCEVKHGMPLLARCPDGYTLEIR